MKIIVERELGPQVSHLLDVHLSEMALDSPAESMHALALDELTDRSITVWSAWDCEDSSSVNDKDDMGAATVSGALMGIGALKELSPSHGEIKSMRTAAGFLRQGVASALLNHIMTRARELKFERLSLETGVAPSFKPAHALYTRFGFEPCAPFADYKEDPFSLFMTCGLCGSNDE